MSLEVFKSNMLTYMQNQQSVDSPASFAKRLTIEYDLAVRSGFETLNQVKVVSGNIQACESLITIALQKALSIRSGNHNVIADIGRGLVAYWTGAQFSPIPPPIIPAVGALYNLILTQTLVTIPGTWSYVSPQLPTSNSGIFLDQLINGINSHLPTISGLHITLSVYPGFPLVPPTPGVVAWQGYTIAPAKPTIISPTQTSQSNQSIQSNKTNDEIVNSLPDDNNTVSGAVNAVKQVGSTEFLSDDGEDAGPQIEKLKLQLKPVVAVLPTPIISEVQRIDVVPEKDERVEVDCGVGLDYDAFISKNYKLADVSIRAVFPHKIIPQGGLSVEEIVCNLKSLTENIIEPLREKYPNIQINSGFRGVPSLPGGKISQHQMGEAVDVQFKGMRPKKYLEVAEFIIKNLPFDQLIFEHGKSIWLHISHKRVISGRKEQLTMLNGKYLPGITCYYS
jgi:hypothetical protein